MVRFENIKLDEIYVDHEFNCRGMISQSQVKGLALEIQESKHVEPIAVQPIEDAIDQDGEVIVYPEAYRWRVLSGHRRCLACSMLRHATIPANIYDDLSFEQAQVINFEANAEREDLDIIQEARWIQRTYPGQSQRAIAEATNKHRAWVRVRLRLLELPRAIQEAAARGDLTWAQIDELWQIPDDERIDYWTVHRHDLAAGKAVMRRGTYGKAVRSRTAVSKMLDKLRIAGDTRAVEALLWAVKMRTDEELLCEEESTNVE